MNLTSFRFLENKAPSEVVIIGGSAAGLFCAYLLAQRGVGVRLFDSNDVMDAAPRTLITTADLIEVMGSYPSEAVVNQVTEIEVCSNDQSARVPLQKPDLVIERAAVVKMLARKAIEAGASIQGKTRFLGFTPAKDGVRVRLRQSTTGQCHELQTRTLIGADGASSLVARQSQSNGFATVPILQGIVELPERGHAHLTKVWFRPEDTSYFYWMIPHSDTEAAVGYIADEGKNSREKLENFIKASGFKVLEIQASRIPLYGSGVATTTRLSGCDIHFVGDAAAQVKVTTVGGLVTGLRGAKAAVGSILGIKELKYESRKLKRELSLHLCMRLLLNKFHASDYDRLVGLLNDRLVTLLSTHNRDQLATLFYRLVLAQPGLLRLALAIFRRS